MSLYSICCGNFHQLRNSIGQSCSIRFLKYHSRITSENVLQNRRHKTRPFSTSVLVRSTRRVCKQSFSNNRHLHGGSVESSIEVFKQSDLQHLKSLQCYDIQEKVSGGKTDCPATILVFDIETTGFSRRGDRIIEFAARDLAGGKNSTFQTLINPEREVKNTFVHGISASMLRRSDVPRFGEFIPILLQYVWSRQVVGKPVMWVAHNGKSFDVPFLIFEFERCKQEMPGDWLFVDTLPIARQLVEPNGEKISSASMDSLIGRYKILVDGNAHRAMRDVTALCYVLQKLTFELRLTVPQLLEKSFRVSDIATNLGKPIPATPREKLLDSSPSSCVSDDRSKGGRPSSPTRGAPKLDSPSSCVSDDRYVSPLRLSAEQEREVREAERLLHAIAERYDDCFLRLRDATAEVADLRRERLHLRAENMQLSLLLEELEAKGKQACAVAPALPPKLPEEAAARGGAPKSISIRSKCYLSQMKQPQGEAEAQRLRVRPPPAIEEAGEDEAQGDGEVEVEAYRQGTQKTELCNKWESGGGCPYADRCRFAHGLQEMRPIIRHPRYKTLPCQMLAAASGCPYGHRCHFRHSPAAATESY